MLDLRIVNESIDFVNVYETEQGNKVVYARELHEGLGIESKYQDWINRMLQYGFEENIDYVIINELTQKKEGSRMVTRNLNNHILKLDMAKEIAMIQRNEKGKAYRKYFIQVEERYKEMITIPSYAIADPIERAKAWIKEEEERQLLEAKNKELQAVNSILSPKANIFDRFINTDTTFTSTDLAKVFNIASARKLNTMLKDNHIAYKQGKSWYAYSTTDATWYKQVVSQYGTQLRWTAQGLVEIAKILDISLNEDTLEQYVS